MYNYVYGPIIRNSKDDKEQPPQTTNAISLPASTLHNPQTTSTTRHSSSKLPATGTGIAAAATTGGKLFIVFL